MSAKKSIAMLIPEPASRSSMFDDARQKVRELKAQCDVLFCLSSGNHHGSAEGLLDGSLPSYLSAMLGKCQAIEGRLDMLESIDSKAKR